MKLEQQCVSLEIAKRLKELGVKQESYFSWAVFPNENKVIIDTHAVHLPECDYYSAFTVAELGEMLPAFVGEGIDNPLRIGKIVGNFGWTTYLDELNVVIQEKNMADSLGKMLIYLLENNLLTNNI